MPLNCVKGSFQLNCNGSEKGNYYVKKETCGVCTDVNCRSSKQLSGLDKNFTGSANAAKFSNEIKM